ncbi:MAG: ligand-binding protein SH3 [spirochete symbiont of Stewartia floridana]|nr:MAG: ligand-binding protein SH3 [spirochete symbiont of Stewartia floridana]
MDNWIWTALLTLLPIAELRGGLPFALLEGNFPWHLAYPFCVLVNALVAPMAFLFLDTAHKLLYKWGFYARAFDRFIEKARRKLSVKVERWGFWGVAVFVGIPLPITGAWTGTLGAWVLGLSRQKTMLAVLAGAAISGLVVSAIILLGIEALSLFIKNV